MTHRDPAAAAVPEARAAVEGRRQGVAVPTLRVRHAHEAGAEGAPRRVIVVGRGGRWARVLGAAMENSFGIDVVALDKTPQHRGVER